MDCSIDATSGTRVFGNERFREMGETFRVRERFSVEVMIEGYLEITGEGT